MCKCIVINTLKTKHCTVLGYLYRKHTSRSIPAPDEKLNALIAPFKQNFPRKFEQWKIFYLGPSFFSVLQIVDNYNSAMAIFKNGLLFSNLEKFASLHSFKKKYIELFQNFKLNLEKQIINVHVSPDRRKNNYVFIEKRSTFKPRS